jgi:hypothetical protein
MKIPKRNDLRRIYQTEPVPAALRGPSLERTAHHEAGHIVLMKWGGLAPTSATATERQGLATWAPDPEPVDLDALDYDEPLAAAQCAAIFHAGIVAELIFSGHPWRGIVYRERSQDWKSANMLLAPHLGNGLAGHGFAQRTALAVLTERWTDVQRIATYLIEHGTWTPENTE